MAITSEYQPTESNTAQCNRERKEHLIRWHSRCKLLVEKYGFTRNVVSCFARIASRSLSPERLQEKRLPWGWGCRCGHTFAAPDVGLLEGCIEYACA